MYLISNYNNLKKIKVDLSIADFPRRADYLQISRRLLSRIESKKGQLMISKLIQKRATLEEKHLMDPDSVGPSFEELYDIFINVIHYSNFLSLRFFQLEVLATMKKLL
jgi:hypothetical protein